MERLKLQCAHCGNDIDGGLVKGGENLAFCCQGCRVVHQTMLENGLERFYDLRDQKLAPADFLSEKSNSFSYLDDQEFQNKKLENKNDLLLIKFYIEGAHCQACLWILEQLPERLSFVKYSRFSLESSILELRVEPGANISQAAKTISSYGYRPRPVFEDAKAKELKLAENRSQLIRAGVAFFCAGNIMLLSASSYSGLEGVLRTWFDWVSLFLCLPVVFYCSIPFYKTSWAAVRNQSFSIDITIAFAVIFGFLVSAWHTWTGQGDIYFDTIAMLVFLLLGSRHLLSLAREKGMSASEVKSFYSNVSALRIFPTGEQREVHASLLAPEDLVQIEAGATFPADGVVESGSSYVNESVLTGESLPVYKKEGDWVYAGAENQSEALRVRVKKSSKASKMGEILERLQSNWGKQTRLARVADAFAKRLTITVSLLSLVVFFYFSWQGRPEEGLQRALAMIIITCPCALGFNMPITLLLGMRAFAKRGIIIKDDHVIEKINAVKNVFMDKTGTITS
ncbi:MAG: heavy metal translocating P-type ATPase metal-binding domain-containing protein, partial [Bacteriovoracaceae bacterium]